MQTEKNRHGRHMPTGYCPAKKRVSQHAKEIASHADPLQLALVQILSSNRADVLRLRDKAEELIVSKITAVKSFSTLQKTVDEFLELLKTTQATAHWMYNPEFDDKGVPYEDVCVAVGRDPDELRDKMFKGIPESLVRMIVGGKRIDCPICGQVDVVPVR